MRVSPLKSPTATASGSRPAIEGDRVLERSVALLRRTLRLPPRRLASPGRACRPVEIPDGERERIEAGPILLTAAETSRCRSP